MFFHPLQLFTIATMFCPGLWVAPTRPPDAPPRARRTAVAYKVIGGLALSQVIWITPPGGRCARKLLCDIAKARRSTLAQSGFRLGTETQPPPSSAPVSERYISSLSRKTCPFVVIPPRPTPTCRNRDVHPTFEWAPRSPVPSLVLAQRDCLLSSIIPIFPGDEHTYAHPSIAPYRLPRPTDVAPISRVLLIAVLITYTSFLRYIFVIMCVVAKFMVRIGGTLRFMEGMKALYIGEQLGLHLALSAFTQFAAAVILLHYYCTSGVNMIVPMITKLGARSHSCKLVLSELVCVCVVCIFLLIFDSFIYWGSSQNWRLLVAVYNNIMTNDSEDITSELLKLLVRKVPSRRSSGVVNGSVVRVMNTLQ